MNRMIYRNIEVKRVEEASVEAAIIERKKRGQSGFTLVELMAVLVIMTLAGMIVATGLPAAMKAYQEAVDASNAQVLLSTTTTRLRDVLSVADPDTGTLAGNERQWTDANAKSYVEFISKETGLYTVIAADDQGHNHVGLCLIEMRLNFDGSPDLKSAVSTPLVPVTATAGKTAELRTKLKSDITKVGDCAQIKDLFVARGSSDTAIANAKIPDDGIKVRFIVD